MEKRFEIEYNNEKIECIVIKSKIKNVYIQIKEGKVVLKAPIRATDKLLKELLEKRKKWIFENIKRQKNKEKRNIDLQSRDYIYVLDKKIYIKYLYNNTNKITLEKTNSVWTFNVPFKFKEDKSLNSKIEKLIEEELKAIAKLEVERAMNKYIKLTGLKPNSITIKKFKRIWGNCSSKRDIKINLNVVFYGIDEIEYVCLHELTHLKYMNHQKEFWNYIRKYMPDYKQRSNKLKLN